MITITTIEPAHFAGLAQLQLDCYPTLGPHELMTVAHFAKQYEVFPQGQIVVLDGGSVVGQGSGFFIDPDFDHPDHTFNEICAKLFHQPRSRRSAWYYGADISVHPDYRGRGIGKHICAAA
ncbi:MAG: GNAT family N-acetyltransferase [Caldilineaceae bacterium]